MFVLMFRKKQLPPFSVVTKFGSNGGWSKFDDEMFGLIYISDYPDVGDNTLLRKFETNLLFYTV